MNPKTVKTDAKILAEIRRLRHLLEKRKLTRVQAALSEAEREIETLRARLREAQAQATAAPTPPTTEGS
jgi:hypothetical protein